MLLECEKASWYYSQEWRVLFVGFLKIFASYVFLYHQFTKYLCAVLYLHLIRSVGFFVKKMFLSRLAVHSPMKISQPVSNGDTLRNISLREIWKRNVDSELISRIPINFTHSSIALMFEQIYVTLTMPL